MKKRDKSGKAPALVSLLDAAKELGISVSTARRYVLSGSLPHVRIAGRIRIQNDAVVKAKRYGIAIKREPGSLMKRESAQPTIGERILAAVLGHQFGISSDRALNAYVRRGPKLDPSWEQVGEALLGRAPAQSDVPASSISTSDADSSR
ncbi:MAG: helix-turn-helix domain-containing protein [Candidatus Acidiferrum sp.]